MEPMLHPLVLALRNGQIVSPFILFSDRILEKPLEINHFPNAEFGMPNAE
jgi:hypothetical protein